MKVAIYRRRSYGDDDRSAFGHCGSQDPAVRLGRAGRAGRARDAKAVVVDLLNSTGLVALDLGSLAAGAAMQQLGGPLSGVELHFVRRLARKN